jgi:hypothetical protein
MFQVAGCRLQVGDDNPTRDPMRDLSIMVVFEFQVLCSTVISRFQKIGAELPYYR